MLAYVPILLCAFSVATFAASSQEAWADECPAGGSHSWQAKIITPSTNDADGLRQYACAKCGTTFTEVIPATGHVWSDWIVMLHPTCTSEGQEYRVCTKHPDNPHYEYRTLPALSSTGQHTWAETTRTEATCTAEGRVVYTCSVCGQMSAEPLPPLGHDWGSWQVAQQPTAEQDGVEERVCKRDASHVETRPVPATGVQSGGTSGGQHAGGNGGDGSTADQQGILPQDFLTAGPDEGTEVLAASTGVVVLVFLLILAPLMAPLAWIRRRRAEARRNLLRADEAQANMMKRQRTYL